jgi:hypothetical protein
MNLLKAIEFSIIKSVCVFLYAIFVFSFLYALSTISDSVRQDWKGDKEQNGKGQPPYKLLIGVGHRTNCWEQDSKA